MTAWSRRCRRIHPPTLLLDHLRAAEAEEATPLGGFGNLCATETQHWLNPWAYALKPKQADEGIAVQY